MTKPAILSDRALVGVAVIAVLVVVAPWDVAAPRVYSGLDPYLVYSAGERDGMPAPVTRPRHTVIRAASGSRSTLHVVNTESSFSGAFDVSIRAMSRPQWQRVRVFVEAPPDAAYGRMLLGVTGGIVRFDRVALVPLAGRADGPTENAPRPQFEEEFDEPPLRAWSVHGAVQRVSRGAGSRNHALRISAPSGTESGALSRALTGPLPSGDRRYAVEGLISSEGSPAAFKIAVQWLDRDLRHLAYRPDWRDWQAYWQSAVAFRARLWHPATVDDLSVVFAGGQITAQSRDRGKVTTRSLGPYHPETPYRVTATWEAGSHAAIGVGGASGPASQLRLRRADGARLPASPLLNLSVDASAPAGGVVQAEVSGLTLTLPSRTRLFAYAADRRLLGATLLIVLWFAAYAGAHLGPLIRRGGLPVWPARASILSRLPRPNARVAWGAVLAISIAALYVAAAAVDGHPFDRLSQETWTHVIARYGIADLYARTSVVPDSAARGHGAPWSYAGIAYPPAIGYFYAFIAKTYPAVFGPIEPMRSRLFHMVLKLALGAFAVVNAWLVLRLLKRRAWGPSTAPLLAAALIVLNPAVIFDNVVWGESDALVTTVLLLSLMGFVSDRPGMTWGFLLLSVFIKQTALLAAPVIGAFALRRFGWRRSLTSGSLAAVACFAVLSPLVVAGYHPATFYLPTVGKFHDASSAATSYSRAVSGDTFPVWVLWTGRDGRRGFERLSASDQGRVPGLPVSYLTAGSIMMAGTFALAGWLAWSGARQVAGARLLSLSVALVFLAYVTFGTRVSGRYLTLALPFLLLGWSDVKRLRALWTPAGISVVSLVSTYGLFMTITVRGEWPSFFGLGTPTTNVFSGMIYRLYTSDPAITLFAVTLVASTAAVAIRAVQLATRRVAPASQPSRPYARGGASATDAPVL